MNHNNNGLHVVDFQKFYKALNPNITTTKSGIQFFNSSDKDEDNAMPQKLLDLKLKSPIHSFFLDLKSSLIFAGGLYPNEDSNSMLADFLKSKNRIGDSVQDVLKKIAYDMAHFEQAYIEVIPSNDSTSIAEIYHKSVLNMRAGEETDEYDQPTDFYFSKTWGDITNKRQKSGKRNDVANAIKIKAFDPNTEISQNQIIHIKKYNGTDTVYPIPSYLSAERWIHLTDEIAKYTHNRFVNGYHLEGFLYLNSTMTDEQQGEFVSEFKNKYKGTEGQKIVFLFNNIASSKPEFVPISDSLSSTVFAEYLSQAVKSICFSHQSSLKILDLSNDQNFGNNSSSDINITRLKYQADVIQSYQDSIKSAFNSIFNFNKLGDATFLNEALKLTLPVLLDTDTTRSERREILLGLNNHPDDIVSSNDNNINNDTIV